MAFDVEGARNAGYSDQEIAEHLASSNTKFNLQQARAGGYDDSEIIEHLTAAPRGGVVTPAAKIGSEFGPEDPGFWGSMMIAGGHGADKVIDGLTQAWLGATGATPSTKAALKASVDEKTRLFQPLADVRPIATAIGESLPAFAVPLGGATSAAGKIGNMAVQGALVPALQYGSAEERLKNAAIGGAASAIGGTVIPTVARTGANLARRGADSLLDIDVPPAVAALYQRARALGIPVSRSQLSDSNFLKTLASTVEKLPFTGGVQTRNVQQDAFNRAVSRTFGEDTPTVNQAVYNTAKTRIGQEFERLSTQNDLQVTPALMADVNRVISDADRFGTGDASRIIRNLAGDLRDHLDTGDMTIPGRAYQAADSQMSKLMKSGDPTSVFIGQLREAVRQGMDHSISPADQAAWMTARGEYRNLKAIRDIVGKAGVDGDISPALLMGRMNSGEASREAMAMGTRGNLGDIAQIGTQFVRDRIPNSGTAQRMLATTIVGGGAGLAGIPAAATMAGTALTTGRVLNRFLNSGASGASVMRTALGTAAAPASLADLLRIESGPLSSSAAGSAIGRTLADYSNRN